MVFGYGAQGHAHALNLRDGGHDVQVVLPQGAKRLPQAKRDGFDVCTDMDAAARQADAAVILSPDETQKELYGKHLKDSLPRGAALIFAHGFAIHFKLFEPRADLDVALVAPKGPGWALRQLFSKGSGIPCVLAVAQDASGNAWGVARDYAKAIGSTGNIETTFENEAVTDLFGEQVVLCGGVPALMRAAYETLVEAGYPKELAYFECVQELKLIADLIAEKGIAGMYDFVSNTAEFGGALTGENIVDGHVRKKMNEALGKIRSGEFARDLVLDYEAGRKTLNRVRDRALSNAIEPAGRVVRGLYHPVNQEKAE